MGGGVIFPLLVVISATGIFVFLTAKLKMFDSDIELVEAVYPLCEDGIIMLKLFDVIWNSKISWVVLSVIINLKLGKSVFIHVIVSFFAKVSPLKGKTKFTLYVKAGVPKLTWVK